MKRSVIATVAKIKSILILIALLTAIMVSSCKNNDTTARIKTTAEKLQGKWRLVSSKTNFYYGSSDHLNSYTYDSTGYGDFRPDGTFYTSVNGSTSTTTYIAKNDTTIFITVNSEWTNNQDRYDKFARKQSLMVI
jgi:hypothetical protein